MKGKGIFDYLPGVGSMSVNPMGDPESAIAPWNNPSSRPL